MTYQKIINESNCPPGRYRYTVPETGYKIDMELSLDGLFKRVERHYIDNNIQLPNDWKNRVEDQLCRQLPPGWCVYTDGSPGKGFVPNLSAEKILKGIKSLYQMMNESIKGNDVFVAQEEANKRAEICSRCYYNMNANFCAGCGIGQSITSAVGLVKGKRTTPSDNELKSCGICGCKNDVIVHVDKKLLLSNENLETTEARPSWCWLKNNNLEEAEKELKI
jgi:hypothetical protein